MDQKVVEKYFRRECTSKEAVEVLAWLRTVEGLRFLEKHIDDYNEIIRNANSLDSDLIGPDDSEKMYLGIQNRIRDEARVQRALRIRQVPDSDKGVGTNKFRQEKKIRSRNTNGEFFVKAVAAVLVMVLTAAGYWWLEQQSPVQDSDESAFMVYSTEQEQHKLLTLVDGTTVRLNENSSLSIPVNYNRDTRRVVLSGEAFFDVMNNSDQPFEVIAGEGVIQVLGTQFNVRMNNNSLHVQVAVLEGEVLLKGHKNTNNASAMLTEGYFGVYHFESRKTIVEEAPVQNYVSWIDKQQIYYENEPLWKISRQLQWMYGYSFVYDNDELRDLSLLASFPKDDLEEVLNIIASTLEIDYSIDGEVVIWKNL